MKKKEHVIKCAKLSDVFGKCMLVGIDEKQKYENGNPVKDVLDHYVIVLPETETETQKILVAQGLPKDLKLRDNIELADVTVSIKASGTGQMNGRYLAELTVGATADRVIVNQK